MKMKIINRCKLLIGRMPIEEWHITFLHKIIGANYFSGDFCSFGKLTVCMSRRDKSHARHAKWVGRPNLPKLGGRPILVRSSFLWLFFWLLGLFKVFLGFLKVSGFGPISACLSPFANWWTTFVIGLIKFVDTKWCIYRYPRKFKVLYSSFWVLIIILFKGQGGINT